MDELDSILREAEAARRRPAQVTGPGVPATPAVDEPRAATSPVPLAVPPGARAVVKFDRFDIKVPEAGPSKIETYRISPKIPLIVVLGVVGLALWLVCPSGIELLRPRPLPGSFVDASARWALVLTAQRIDRFAADRGRLPTSLEELDSNVSDIVTYQRLPDDVYLLQAPGRKGLLVLQPHESRAGFLGKSNARLRGSLEAAP